jgi:hypothetical protein
VFFFVVCRPLLVSQEEAEENTIDGGHTKLKLIKNTSSYHKMAALVFEIYRNSSL